LKYMASFSLYSRLTQCAFGRNAASLGACPVADWVAQRQWLLDGFGW
jgi:hypothetical protein